VSSLVILGPSLTIISRNIAGSSSIFYEIKKTDTSSSLSSFIRSSYWPNIPMPSFLFLLLYSWFCSSWAIAISFSAQFFSSSIKFPTSRSLWAELRFNVSTYYERLSTTQQPKTSTTLNSWRVSCIPESAWIVWNRAESWLIVGQPWEIVVHL